MANIAVRPIALSPSVWVSGQITAADVPLLRDAGFTDLVALRPDNEERGQPAADDIGDAAVAVGLGFAHIPVAPGPIPQPAVAELQGVLANRPAKALIYCKSGARAARTWALAEAGLLDGPDAADIARAVQAGRFPVDDLAGRIHQAVDGRKSLTHQMPAFA